MLSRILTVAVAAATIAFAGSARAEFPDKTITIVVPSTPGSQPTLAAQIVGEAMQTELKTTVVVMNRPGANQMIGISSVARADPDGYTILQAAGSLVNAKAFAKEPPFDGLNDFRLLGSTTLIKLVLATGPTAPFSDYKSLIDYAKANPGKLRYSSTGADDPRLFFEAMIQDLGLDMVHVPYSGTAESIPALIAGDIHLVWVAPSRVLDGNKLQPLAVTGSERIKALPDTPASTEVGLKDAIDQVFDFYVPAGTPDDAADKLSAALDKVVVNPAVLESLAKAGLTVRRESPADSKARLEARAARVAEIAKAAGIEPQ